ncbi:hypothetical protein CTAYLR_009427 [Chrysophaeum taylorii]|uniref:Raptor N-terminal CASPase-like domain-containing protein n=1 Tax=Chrysophaeum taylorii TaxID=2483200 RepID=A0AAD7UK47_9STRA|nr:hypothetical protein CTAYLR_009427 [Chrysophaeum taylorii]
MSDDLDAEEEEEIVRRRASRHRGPGVTAPRAKEVRLLGLRAGSEAEAGLAELLLAEELELRALEMYPPAFRGGRSGASFFPGGTHPEEAVEPTWRLRERMKTVSVALVLCLNIGTDPPDAARASPRARKECWLDPFASPSRQKALEAIGAALQSQYERWQSRARYRQLLDPTADELRRMCAALRRSARADRVLVHLNGHGVPRPTANGEVWVFNKNYTQYIPLSVYDLRAVTQSPAVYVLECSSAGVLLPHFAAPLRQRKEDGCSEEPPRPSDDIVLAPCGADETLPTDPRLPADLFTACLTTPVAVALRWFVHRHPYSTGSNIALDVVDVPGRLGDRKTPLGELNWIFTAVTDTIAWNALPAPLFQRLFRQDLLLASLFRNFLLAERVLKAHNCTPATLPRLPSTADHPLWSAWDLAAEGCLAQLALGAEVPPAVSTSVSMSIPPTEQHQPQQPAAAAASAAASAPAAVVVQQSADNNNNNNNNNNNSDDAIGEDDAFEPGREFGGLRGVATLPPPRPRPLEASPFFEEQLSAFEVWLRFGASRDALDAPPEQLPVVLQVLLSQAHRVRALVLLRRFLELGARAVNLALCVGIFPYVLKLLQSPAPELRRPLVAIWAAILAFDDSCKHDLVKDGAHAYFLAHAAKLADLRDHQQPGPPAAAGEAIEADELEDQSLLSAFVLSTIIRGDDPQVRAACLQKRLDASLLELLRRRRRRGAEASASASPSSSSSGSSIAASRRGARLRRWLCLCAASLCEGYGAAKAAARRRETADAPSLAEEACAVAAGDEDPSVRAAAVRLVAALVYDDDDDDDEHQAAAAVLDAKMAARLVLSTSGDASAFVRREVALAIATFATVAEHRRGLQDERTRARVPAKAVKLLGEEPGEEKKKKKKKKPSLDSPYGVIWACVAALATDPVDAVADVARDVVDALGEDAARVVEHRLDALARTRGGVEEWAARMFAPEVRAASIDRGQATRNDDDPLSRAGELGLYRRHRNRYALREASALADRVRVALTDDDDDPAPSPEFSALKFLQALTLDNSGAEMTRHLGFHPHEPYLAVVDAGDGISLWDYEAGAVVARWHNNQSHNGRRVSRRSTPARVTALEWLDASRHSLVLCGSDDGVARVWTGFGLEERDVSPRLLTALVADDDLADPSPRSSGLVCAWSQRDGILYTAGDSPFVRAWDARAERLATVWGPLDTPSACATCVCAHDSSNLVFVGFGDGSLRLLDPRSPARPHAPAREHDAWIVHVSCHDVAPSRELVSACLDGNVRFWDLRSLRFSLRTLSCQTSTMAAFDAHSKAPLLASGSHNQFVKFMARDARQLNIIRYHDGFLGQRIGPISAIAFHPTKLLCAAGSMDPIVGLYACSC